MEILAGSLPAAGNLPELQLGSNEGMYKLKRPDKDPELVFFQNLQLLSRSFSGILSSRPVLFSKSSARDPDFFQNLQLPGRSFFRSGTEFAQPPTEFVMIIRGFYRSGR
jgi:hypothetical protein